MQSFLGINMDTDINTQLKEKMRLAKEFAESRDVFFQDSVTAGTANIAGHRAEKQSTPYTLVAEKWALYSETPDFIEALEGKLGRTERIRAKEEAYTALMEQGAPTSDIFRLISHLIFQEQHRNKNQINDLLTPRTLQEWAENLEIFFSVYPENKNGEDFAGEIQWAASSALWKLSLSCSPEFRMEYLNNKAYVKRGLTLILKKTKYNFSELARWSDLDEEPTLFFPVGRNSALSFGHANLMLEPVFLLCETLSENGYPADAFYIKQMHRFNLKKAGYHIAYPLTFREDIRASLKDAPSATGLFLMLGPKRWRAGHLAADPFFVANILLSTKREDIVEQMHRDDCDMGVQRLHHNGVKAAFHEWDSFIGLPIQIDNMQYDDRFFPRVTLGLLTLFFALCEEGVAKLSENYTREIAEILKVGLQGLSSNPTDRYSFYDWLEKLHETFLDMMDNLVNVNKKYKTALQLCETETDNFNFA